MTLPFMSLMMLGAALSAAYITWSPEVRTGVMALFVFCKTTYLPCVMLSLDSDIFYSVRRCVFARAG